MSYTPTEWQTGDTITAEKLNKLENGVAGGGGKDVYSVFALPGDYSDGDVIDSESLSLLMDALYDDNRPAVMTVNFEDASYNYIYGIFVTSYVLPCWNCIAGDSAAIGSTLVVDTLSTSETYGKITVTPNQPEEP